MGRRRVHVLSSRHAVICPTGRILNTSFRSVFLDKRMQCPHCHRQVSASAKNCSSCGGHIPDGQYLLEDAGIIETALSAASAKQTGAARNQASPPVAKLGARFTAFVLDTMVLFGVFAVGDAWIFMHWGTR